MKKPLASPHRHTFSATIMDENIETANSLISKWDSDDSSNYCNLTSLFDVNNRHEATQYLNAVKQLQSAMHYYINRNPTSQKLVQAQNLMQIAMKRLEKEFYRMLKSNRHHLDAESVSSHLSRSSTNSEDESEDDMSPPTSVTAMTDLKAIADCMIALGYAKESVKIYKLVRKSIVDESLYSFGVERTLSVTQLQKMDRQLLEVKIKNWLRAVKFAVRTLFYGERILCDYVFSASASITESCFSVITKDAALALFGFPENVAKCKRTSEKMFSTLDLYEAIAELWPEIESIFSFDSTSTVRLQAVHSLIKLGEAVRTSLTDFESAISKDNSKTPVPGAGVHPLTRYVMNYVAFLADYSGVLSDIVADWPLMVQPPLPGSYLGSPELESGESTAISVRFAWLILVLLCKLDGKAELYKDVAQSYLFLANNLKYVVNKVRSSCLRLLIGDDWIAKHDAKVRQYALNYERVGWSKVFASLPENSSAAMTFNDVADRFKRFNQAFEEACKKQSDWVVPDSKLRDQIKLSVAGKIIPVYRKLYEKFRFLGRSERIIRFAPDDLGNYLSDLFFGTSGGQGSYSSASSSTSSFPNSPRGGKSR